MTLRGSNDVVAQSIAPIDCTDRYLVAERGIRQFLGIGTGIPTQPNLHEVVQAVTPDARIVYVENGPIVLAPGH